MTKGAGWLLLSAVLLGCKDTRFKETRNLTPGSPEQRQMQARLSEYQAKNVECISLQDLPFEGRQITQSCFGEVFEPHVKAFFNHPIQTTSTLNVITVGNSPKGTGTRQCHRPEGEMVLCLETHRSGSRVLQPQHLFAFALK